MKISLIQTVMGLSADETLPRAKAAMLEAMSAAERPDFLVLPEYFSYYGVSQADAVAMAKPLRETPAFLMAQAFAREHKVGVQAGTILARVENDTRVENVSVVFDREGEVIAEYRKIHLFAMGDMGNGAFDEADYIKPGQEIVTWNFDGVTFGTAICFDGRFPELFRALRLRGAEVITLPAAYTMVTGEAHWELLARARAVETQCYFLACGLGGSVVVEGQTKASYGHSVIVDPWGRVLEKAGPEAAILSVTLDLAELGKIRHNMPVIQQRRLLGETIMLAE